MEVGCAVLEVVDIQQFKFLNFRVDFHSFLNDSERVMKTFTHSQETWDKAECERRANYAPKNAFGDRPPKGIIAHCSSPYPSFGQTRRYNGGFIALDGKWYEAESKPLPKIHEDYEIFSMCSWGTAIRKKVAV